jgi:tetratricopeptide (TPR) repeat protein
VGLSTRISLCATLTILCLLSLRAAQQTPNAASTIQDLISAGDFQRARDLAEKAAEQSPRNAPLWNLVGIARGQAGDYAGAEQAFRRALSFDSTLVSVWLNAGRLYQLNSEKDSNALDKGIEAYTRALKLDASNREAHHQLALLLQWKGSFHQSLAQLDLLPPGDQSRRAVLALRCANEAGLGNTKGALAAANRLLLDPELEEADVLAILPMVQKHNPAVAQPLLERVVERGLASKETRAQLAAVYEQNNELERARETYEMVAKESPDRTAPLTDLARVAFKQKDYEGALGYLGHARDLEPANAGIHYFFGITCNELHLPVMAKQSLEKALQLAPDDPYYNFAMGIIELQSAETTRAVPYLRKYTAAHPADPRGSLALGTAYFYADQFEECKRVLLPVAQMSPVKDGAQYLLGLTARHEGKFDDALTYFEEALKANPRVADAHSELAQIYFSKGDLDLAHKETDAALALDRDNFTANQVLLRIYRKTSDPRMDEQVARLKTLAENRDHQIELLTRTIEVRPY